MCDNYPDEDRINFLVSRHWYKEEYNQINQLLNKFVPNTHIVAPFSSHIQIDLDNCLLFNPLVQSVKHIQMKTSHCHDNCVTLFKNKIIELIYTGYALSVDGLWRFHSWGMDKQYNLIETTESRLLYWGIAIG